MRTDGRPDGAVDEGFVLPASSAQQRIWLLHQLDPLGLAYSAPSVAVLRGVLDVDALERALDEIVSRHETLRTTFALSPQGRLQQLVAPHRRRSLPVLDVSGDADPGAAATCIADRTARTPFDLSRGPVMRTALIRLRPAEHWLLLTIHHIATDHWSREVLIREIAVAYGAFREHRAPALPELELQYADFAVWEAERIGRGALDHHLGYWRRKLAGYPRPVSLPPDRPRPKVRSFRGEVELAALPRPIVAGVHALARRARATPFAVLLGALDVLLFRYTGQEDIVVGCPIANRTRRELEPLIGCFVNTVPIRISLDPEQRFDELLTRVKAACLEAYDHQEAPFEKLVESLQPTRQPGGATLFGVLLAYQSTVGPAPELPGLETDFRETHTGTTKFDLTLAVMQSAGGLDLLLEYDVDLYSAATIRGALDTYRRILGDAVADPGRRLIDLPLHGVRAAPGRGEAPAFDFETHAP